MDLRRRISLCVAVAFLVMSAAVLLGTMRSLQADVAEEMRSSAHLVSLLKATVTGDEAQLEELVAGPFRHVRVAMDRSVLEQPSRPGAADESGLMAQLARRWVGSESAIERISVGGRTLYVQSDPGSEIEEILHDARQWLTTVLVFCLLIVFAVWVAVDRALAPARRLEARIMALDGMGPLPPAQRFALKEYTVLSGAIDRLSEKLMAARAAQRTLAQCLISVQEDERKEIARELHDEFGQTLTAIGVSAAYVERNAGRASPRDLAQAAADICTQSGRLGFHLRALLSRLRPHGLEGVGLLSALRDVIDDWQRRGEGMQVRIDLPEELPRLAPGTALSLYRGLQEALTNVTRHSGASRVHIRLSHARGQVCLQIEDNGLGAGAATGSVRPGVGLLGMRERVVMAGGHLAVSTPPGGGFELRLSLPV
jgi:two-component system sensor histidine kinase UhpB